MLEKRLSRMCPGFGREDEQYGAVRKKDRAAEGKGTKIMLLFALGSPTRHLNMPIQSYKVTSVTCSIEVDILAQCYEIARKRRTYERLTASRTKNGNYEAQKVFGCRTPTCSSPRGGRSKSKVGLNGSWHKRRIGEYEKAWKQCAKVQFTSKLVWI